MPFPMRAAMILPSDCMSWADHAPPLARKSVEIFRDWCIEETDRAGKGKWGFDFEFTAHQSVQPRSYFHTNQQGVFEVDPHGDMIWETRAWDVVRNELKWPVWEGGVRRGDQEFRWMVTVIHGGGVALGRATPWDHYDRELFTHEQTGDYGQALYGDWDWRFLVTGINAPTAGPYGNARFAEGRRDRISISYNHEGCHCLNMDCHNPVLWPGLDNHHMTPAHVEQYLKYNAAFISKQGSSVIVPELPPEPVPIPPPPNPLTVTPTSAILHRYFGKRSVTVTTNKPITQVKSLNTSVAIVTQLSATEVKISHAPNVRPSGTSWQGGTFVQVAIVCGTERVFFPVTVRW